MTKYLDEHPELRRFAAAVDGTIHRPEDIFECVEALSELSLSGFASNFINSELRKAAENEFYRIRTSILAGQEYMLGFEPTGLAQARQPILWGSPRHQLFCVASDKSIASLLYERQVVGPEDVFAPEEPLELKHRQIRSRGETIAARSNRDFFYCEAEHPTLMIVLSSNPVSHFRWLYRTNTLLPCGICPARTSSRKLELSLVLAGKLQMRDALPIVSRFLHHEEFCVRWTALQTVLRLDQDAGLRALDHAVNDVHPEIRRRALSIINSVAGGMVHG